MADVCLNCHGPLWSEVQFEVRLCEAISQFLYL